MKKYGMKNEETAKEKQSLYLGGGSEDLFGEGKLEIVLSPKAYIEGENSKFFPKPRQRGLRKNEEIWGGNMTKYEGKIKKYEGKMQKYEGKYEGNMTKYWPQDFEKFRAFLKKGEGKSYADTYADTIPGMAPSTEREGGSPANMPLFQLDEYTQRTSH